MKESVCNNLPEKSGKDNPKYREKVYFVMYLIFAVVSVLAVAGVLTRRLDFPYALAVTMAGAVCNMLYQHEAKKNQEG